MNFDYLDDVFDLLTKNRLRPIFELMGVPKGMINFEVYERNEYKFWYEVVYATVSHCIRK